MQRVILPIEYHHPLGDLHTSRSYNTARSGNINVIRRRRLSQPWKSVDKKEVTGKRKPAPFNPSLCFRCGMNWKGILLRQMGTYQTISARCSCCCRYAHVRLEFALEWVTHGVGAGALLDFSTISLCSFGKRGREKVTAVGRGSGWLCGREENGGTGI